MTTGHADSAPGASRRTPHARDSHAAALGLAAPGGPDENSVELTASVRRWVAEAARAGPNEPFEESAAAATRAAPSSSGVRDPLPERRVTTAARPQRGTSAGANRSRVALLVDPAGLDQDALGAVLAAVHDAYDRPAVGRAYADWTRPEARGQLKVLGDHAVQPVHAIASNEGHTLVALTVDALDAVATYGVNCVVLVADLEAVLPLVIRLRASGTRVVAAGPATTPPDVRIQADEFIAIDALDHPGAHPIRGRHRSDAPLP